MLKAIVLFLLLSLAARAAIFSATGELHVICGETHGKTRTLRSVVVNGVLYPVKNADAFWSQLGSKTSTPLSGSIDDGVVCLAGAPLQEVTGSGSFPDIGGDGPVLGLVGGVVRHFESKQALAEANQALVAEIASRKQGVNPSLIDPRVAAGAFYTPEGWAIGEKRLLVLMATCSDVTEPVTGWYNDGGHFVEVTLTKELIESKFGPAINDIFAKRSFGKLTLKVTGDGNVYKLPKTSDEYRFADGAENFEQVYQDTVALASVNNDLSAYDHVMICMPTSEKFLFGGYGDVSGKRTWVGIMDDTISVHELGHNFGLLHAMFVHDAPSVPTPVVEEYGDYQDYMGSSSSNDFIDFHIWEKYFLGWVDDAAFPRITSSGVYRIYRSNNSSDPTRVLGLRIQKNGLIEYALSSIENDHMNNPTNFANSLFVAQSNLDHIEVRDASQKNDFFQCGLEVGNTFNDSKRGVSFKTVATGGTGDDHYVDVEVKFEPRRHLSNISTRCFVGSGGNVAIAGFVLKKKATVLIRGVGPGLSVFGVGNVVAKPVLTLFDASGKVIASNEGWKANPDNVDTLKTAMSNVGAFAPADDDSAIYLELEPGNYTAQVAGATGNGNGLIEVYLDKTVCKDYEDYFLNLSTRCYVSSGDSTAIAGFVVDAPTAVMIRGIGPTLKKFGLTGTVTNPQMAISDSTGKVLLNTHDIIGLGPYGFDCLLALEKELGAFTGAIEDSGAMMDLEPGNYTAQVTPTYNAGTGLVEVYLIY